MKQRGLTCIGTIRKNKREIPPEFLPKKSRVIRSALYGFTKDITLVSFVPQKNKAVVLVPSSHHHKSEDPESGKPHIILDYNCTKGGVDAIDEKCSKFSCSRRSRR
ncbi:hypothetical protein NQ314_008634 [Rhamnusium bicolor]|uniref:PiggyBac transposable element-derived protein domain-containing protein n=1 Tax=Rhamnusium bicolor TaxID=1586634 RepID=A0AAV8Y8N1_9CUCU|nr:hypothetical protein NQ314_008634 [Rhamnusium bicolor]